MKWEGREHSCNIIDKRKKTCQNKSYNQCEAEALLKIIHCKAKERQRRRDKISSLEKEIQEMEEKMCKTHENSLPFCPNK